MEHQIMNNAITVDHLTKDFGHGRGIFDVSFNVRPGEVFGFLGPNGAGKTTTIRHLMGFTKPDQGSATILGKNALPNHAEIMQHVGYLPGEVVLPEDVTGWEFIRTMQRLRHVSDDRYLKELLTMFELDPSGSTKKMSLGTKRKLAVVCAFLADPEILILDEPTSGLDPAMQERFIQFMIKEKQRQKTILLSSHIFPEIEATCDQISIIKAGKLVANLDAQQLKHPEMKHFGLFFANSADLAKAQTALVGKADFSNLSLTVDIPTAKLTDFFQNALSGLTVTKITENRFDLEKYFLDFYKTDQVFEAI